jgi:hypothetical protein
MGLNEPHSSGTVRLSWCHVTEEVDPDRLVQAIRRLRA